jgi:hypothetical protein
MLDVETAVKIAEEALNNHFQLENDWVVVVDMREDEDAYWFMYNSRHYVETGDLMFAIVEGHPIGIRKRDGSIV